MIAALIKIATGKLLTLDNQIDTTTGTLKLRAIFANSNGALFPNQFVNTRLLVQTLQNMTLDSHFGNPAQRRRPRSST
jgi:membrane fusion protein, multidrug efflux system